MAKLSRRQKQIIRLMDEHGTARFWGYTRGFFWRVEEQIGGVSIQAYQSPQLFLEQRKLIERCDRNVPGYWYQLTEAGKEAAQKLRGIDPENMV